MTPMVMLYNECAKSGKKKNEVNVCSDAAE